MIKNNISQLLDLILSLWFSKQGYEVVPKSMFGPSIECNAQFSGEQIVNDPKNLLDCCEMCTSSVEV